MATLNFGRDFKSDAHEIKSYMTMRHLVDTLVHWEHHLKPAELSVYQAEVLERIAAKIRDYYAMPKVEEHK